MLESLFNKVAGLKNICERVLLKEVFIFERKINTGFGFFDQLISKSLALSKTIQYGYF